MRRNLPALLIVLSVTTCANAQADKYHVTTAEKLACISYAERFCIAAYPDEDKLVGCMRANRTALSDECGAAFDTGMKRRGLR